MDAAAPNLAPIGKKAGLALGKKQKGLLVTGEDRLGAMADKAAALAAKNVNIVTIHALAPGGGRYSALVAVAPADFRKALKALGA